MQENVTSFDYYKEFSKPSIKVGSITVALAMLASFFPNIYLYFAYGIFPDISKALSAWGSIAIAFGAFYIVEPISYFPVFGLTGTYIGILSGNIAQIRLPAASTAQDVMGVEPSSHKGEIVAILAISGSVITNILFLTVAVVAGSTIVAVLPAGVTAAMSSYILPSLFGACLAQMAIKKPIIALYALPIAIILRLLGIASWIIIVGSIFGTILITYILYKKGTVK